MDRSICQVHAKHADIQTCVYIYWPNSSIYWYIYIISARPILGLQNNTACLLGIRLNNLRLPELLNAFNKSEREERESIDF